MAAAVKRTGARIVHAHNLHPTLGWRALAAAKAEGARVVLHLHQYRLVCAVGTCFTHGEECTRCHGRNTLPGLVRGCRGGLGESVAYAYGIARQQQRLVELADKVIVPSEFARRRLLELGAPLRDADVHVLAPPLREFAQQSQAASGRHALLVARLAPEKGIEIAIDACERARIPLVIAGGGRAPADRPGVRFAGQLDDDQLRELRESASLALQPTLSAETFGLAAAESMAAGLPVVGSRIGALPELLPAEGLVPPGDAIALAAVAQRLNGDQAAGERALHRVRARCSPNSLAASLAHIYS